MDRLLLASVFGAGALIGGLAYREYADWSHQRVLRAIYTKLEQQMLLRSAARQGEQLGLYRMGDAALSTVN